jgi:transcriptional regulator with XRE-family HTH domain
MIGEMATNAGKGPRNYIRPRQQGSDTNSAAYKRIQAEMAIALGERLYTWRQQAGLTQQQVGDAVGVKAPQVSGWETGKKPVKEAHIASYAEVLGVPRETLTRTLLRYTQPIVYVGLFGAGDDEDLARITGEEQTKRQR